MAIISCESFDKVTWAILAAKGPWTTLNSSFMSISSSFGRNGGSGLGYTTSGTSVGSTWTPSAAISDGILHFFGSSANIGQRWLGFWSGSTNHIYFLVSAAGKMEAWHASGVLLGTSTTSVNGSANHFQIRIKIDDTTGRVVVKINDVTEIDFTGDTRNGASASFDSIRMGHSASGTGTNGGAPACFDDWVITDTSGSLNTGYLGDVRVQALSPSAAGNSAQFTPLSSTNVSNVDDTTGHDSDTTYNSDGTANHVDSFATGDLTPTAGTIYAVQHVVIARSDDAGSHTLKPLVRISGTDYAIGSGQSVSTSYKHIVELSEQSPASSSAWSISEVNAMETGYKLIS